MTTSDQDRPTTEAIAGMGREDDRTATTTADDRPEVRHDTLVGDERTDGGYGDQRPDAGYGDQGTGAGYGGQQAFDDGQAHPAPATPPVVEAAPSAARTDSSDVQLMPEEHAARLRDQWHQVQSTFVDDPRGAVSQADTLVAEVMQTLASGFAEHKRGLEESWQRGEEAGTEDLRQALQSYRAFFDRLLHT
jgi:hypothetical protein